MLCSVRIYTKNKVKKVMLPNNTPQNVPSLNIPSKDECLRLIAEEKMMDNIILHSKQVGQVALFLTDRLNAVNFKLNRNLIFAAALLHDITKTRSITTGENHAKSGAEMILALGYPEVGDIIAQHVHLDHFCFHDPPNEAELVNYADKRVLHENVVSLDERMAYIVKRYVSTPDHMKRICDLWKESQQLEQKLFGYLTIDADNLAVNLSKTPSKEPQ
jgi:putative nucleotidyltransferase with HDIG domain